MAKRRNIAWLLTYEQWIHIWNESGKLHLRGRKLGCYCMSRPGDKGPYAVGNVVIIKHAENSSGRVYTEAYRQNLSRARIGKKHSVETRAKMSLAQRAIDTGHFRGHHHTKETKAKIAAAGRGRKYSDEAKAHMSAAQYKRWAKEKSCPTI